MIHKSVAPFIQTLESSGNLGIDYPQKQKSFGAQRLYINIEDLLVGECIVFQRELSCVGKWEKKKQKNFC